MTHCNHSYRPIVNLSYGDFRDDNRMAETHRIGSYIKRQRESLGLSQEALARQLGISRVALTKWESGATKNLKQDNLSGLSAIFGVPLEELLHGENAYRTSTRRAAPQTESPAAAYNKPAQPDEIAQVAALMYGMSEKKRTMILIFTKLIDETDIL